MPSNFGINTHVGATEETDNSSTTLDFHVLEIHKATAGWMLFFLGGLILTAAAVYLCRRHQRKRRERRERCNNIMHLQPPLPHTLGGGAKRKPQGLPAAQSTTTTVEDEYKKYFPPQ